MLEGEALKPQSHVADETPDGVLESGWLVFLDEEVGQPCKKIAAEKCHSNEPPLGIQIKFRLILKVEVPNKGDDQCESC